MLDSVVRVKDPGANTNKDAKDTIKVHVETTSDKGHDIVLTETGNDTGEFESAYLVLTTFTTDNATAGNQAFNSKLGDTVTAVYGGKEAKAKVPVQKVVKLHVSILNQKKGGQPLATKEKVMEEVEDANKIYAPVGILFTESSMGKDSLGY